METKDDLTDNSLVDDAHVTSPNGGAAVESSTLTLAELNTVLGKDFKDKDTALKALKDTQSYVGMKKEDIAAEVKASLTPAPAASPAQKPTLESDVKSIKDRLFFSENPQYKGYEGIIAKMGTDPAEVVGSPEFKTVFENGKVATEVANTRSIVNSNPRLAQTQSVTSEAVKLANTRGTTQEDVATILARGILAEAE